MQIEDLNTFAGFPFVKGIASCLLLFPFDLLFQLVEEYSMPSCLLLFGFNLSSEVAVGGKGEQHHACMTS